MTKLLLLVLALTIFGCASLTHPRPSAPKAGDPPQAAPPKGSPDECKSWDDSHVLWSTLAAGGAAGAGVGGITAALDDRDKTGRIVVGSVALGFAIFSAIAVTAANSNAARFTERCSQ